MITAGRLEFLDFTEWNLEQVQAKIDTGAYGNAIHCHHVEMIEGPAIRFQLLDPTHPEYEAKYYESSDFRVKTVKSSSGIAETRFSIKTSIRFFGKKFRTEFSLANREEMKYPVLLGRKFLKKRFLVDVSKKNLSVLQNNEL
ncbi:MAG: RimK/LysX family protein [Cyclobacteriaceae bacterium]